MTETTREPSRDTELANSQKQVEQLSQEVLELYRQVNLLYRLGDVFRSGLQVEDVCALLISESAKVVRARSACVTLGDGVVYGERPDSPASTLTVAINTPQGRIGEITLFDKKRGFFTASDEKLIKAVALKYWGPRGFQAARPFFLGAILGQFTSAGLWLLIDACTGMTDNRIFSW